MLGVSTSVYTSVLLVFKNNLCITKQTEEKFLS